MTTSPESHPSTVSAAYPQAQTVRIEGPDAIHFAHSQLASDVRSLAPGNWQWSAWLSAQGRVRFLLQVAHTESEVLILLLRGGRAEELARQIRPYVFRSRVDVNPQPPGALRTARALPTHEVALAASEIRLGMGRYALRIMPLSDAVAVADPAGQPWRVAAIQAGQPWLPESVLGTLLPPALGLADLGAVRLDKGCFPGQEIVARLHYRGGNKQHLHRIEGPAQMPPGHPVTVSGRGLGSVLDSVPHADGTLALAVLRDILPPGSDLIDDHLGRMKVLPLNTSS